MADARRYRAFISYSHRDETWARWLHSALERTTIDRDLVGKETRVGAVPKSLRPIFRDREDFSAAASLAEQTRDALNASEFLIIVCSPNAARSLHVNEEIRFFKAAGNSDRVLPIIVSGEPGHPELECFPKALRHKVRPDGSLTREVEEPIAADARSIGDGKDVARLKLVAALLGLTLDEVIRRAKRESRRQLVRWIVGLAVATLALAGLGLWAEFNRHEAERQRQEAARQGDEATQQMRAARESRIQALRGQAEYVARLARQMNADGDHAAALALALAVSPTGRSDNAYLPSELVEGALIEAYSQISERKAFSMRDVVWGPSDSLLISAGHIGRKTQVHSARTGDLLREFSGSQNALYPTPDLLSPRRNLVAVIDGNFVRILTIDAESLFEIAIDTIEDGNVKAMQFSHDETLIAVSFSSGRTAIWVIGQSIPVAEWTETVSNVNLSFSHDAKHLLVSAPSYATVRHVMGGKILQTVEMEGVAWGPVWLGNESDLVMSRLGVLTFWDAKLARQTRQTIPGLQLDAISSSGSLGAVIAGSKVLLYDLREGTLIGELLAHTAEVHSAAFSADGLLLVTASSDRTAIMWSTRTGVRLQTLRGHLQAVTNAEFSPDQRMILTNSTDNTARLWAVLPNYRGLFHQAIVGEGFEISDDLSVAVEVTEAGEAVVWSTSNGDEIRRIDDFGNRAPILSSDGRWIGQLSQTNDVRIWSAETGIELSALSIDSKDSTFLKFVPGRDEAVTVDGTGRVILWDLKRTKVIYDFGTLPFGAETIAFSSDGRTMAILPRLPPSLRFESNRIQASNQRGPRAVIIDVETGNVKSLLVGWGRWTRIFLSSDGSIAASLQVFGEGVAVWDTTTGKNIHLGLGEGLDNLSGVAISADNARLVAGDRNGLLRVWDIRSGDTRTVMNRPGDQTISVSFDDWNDWILGKTARGVVVVWSASTGEELLQFSLGKNARWLIRHRAATTLIAPKESGLLTYKLLRAAELVRGACEIQPRPLSTDLRKLYGLGTGERESNAYCE